jgi:cupin fold WbuC family metalloprotein
MENTTIVKSDLLEKLIEKAEGSERKRALHIVRSSEKGEVPAIMFNALMPGTYIQPHQHPSKDGKEIWVPIRGLITGVIFDNAGQVKEHYHLSPRETTFIEIPAKTFHTAIATEPSVLCELYMGIFEQETYKSFASWAPEERSEQAVEYLDELVRRYCLVDCL